MANPLSEAELQTALDTLPGWSGDGNAISKTYTFADFKEAFGFMTRAAFEAEALGHHPDWSNVYRTVNVKLNTHDAGGRVTALDVQLARALDGLYDA